MSNRLAIPSSSSSPLSGAFAAPPGDAKAPALVLIQEWFGLNEFILAMVDRFAAAGFVTLAPDLYHGKIATSDAEAGAMMKALDTTKAVAEIGAAVSFLSTHPRSTGKVGVTGFCLGGGLALAAGVHVPGISALAPFYGNPGPLDFSKITAPVQAHFAKKDDWAKLSGAEEIKRQVDAAGKTTFELHAYDAGHAFMRFTDGHYDADAAKLAWDRVVPFLHEHLG
jgi:carboxymethylenebutenolidase